MRVDFESQAGITVPEPFLSDLKRRSHAVHESFIRVAESMESAPLDPKTDRQGTQLSLDQDIRIPRRTVACGEEQALRVGVL